VLKYKKGVFMETKIAVVAIIVSDLTAVERVNQLLHEFGEFIIGRMGVPYKEKKVNVISVVIDAPQEIVNNLSGKLGMIKGVSSKVLTTK
jgi:putative iron-only hydrogenase system regulator